MSTPPFGAAGFGIPSFDPSDWQRLASQWFAGMAPTAPAANATVDPFAFLRSAQPQAAGLDPTTLASQWLSQIQQLATQFSGQDAQPAEIARAWRSLVGDNPFASAIAGSAFMPPAFAGFTGGGRGPMDMPAFGYTREHQERAQRFAKAVVEFQEASQAFQKLIGEAGQEAFSRFESLLANRASEGKPVESARGLFDLWIDAAEDAYADIALSERFQRAFGDYVNAQMRVRAAMQKEVELACAQWGIPGREEVDAAHRKIAELKRELGRLRTMVAAQATGRAPAGAEAQGDDPSPADRPRSSSARNTAGSSKKTAGAKTGTEPKQTATKRVKKAAKKATARKATTNGARAR